MFFLSAGMLIGTGILFVLFSDSTEQHWNKFNDEENGENDLKTQYSKVPLDDLPYNEKCKDSSQLTS